MLGLSLTMIAAGAILRFAVADGVEGVDLSTLGLILMVVGGVGVLLSVMRRPRFHTHTERAVSPDGRHVVEDHYTDA